MFLILVVLSAQAFLTQQEETEKATAACVIDVVGDTPNKSPLVVDDTGAFRNPLALNDVRVHFDHNETFWLACPGGTFAAPVWIIPAGEKVTCQRGEIISIENTSIYFSDIVCNLDLNRRPYLLEAADGIPCEMRGTITTIGYSSSGGPVPVYAACLNRQSFLPFYVKYLISRWANSLSGHSPTTTIRTYDSEIPSLYDRSHSSEILRNLGYYDDFYLEEGFLAANNDFFYPFQRDATSSYANVAPQWHGLKVGNWVAVQKSITNLIRYGTHGDFTAYAGTLGITRLDDKVKGGSVRLYLDEPKLPVPRWFWRLIYSEVTQEGSIIVSYNNPYISAKEDVDQEFRNTICWNDDLKNLTWLTGVDNSDARFGYTYACLLHETIDAGLHEVVSKLLGSVKNKYFGNLN